MGLFLGESYSDYYSVGVLLQGDGGVVVHVLLVGAHQGDLHPLPLGGPVTRSSRLDQSWKKVAKPGKPWAYHLTEF